jgi:hypothetical protein
MIIHKHWEQIGPLSSMDESFFNDELSSTLEDFIANERYKEYYNNHVVVEKRKNVARLFNKNTEEYIAMGFFNSDVETPKKIRKTSEIESKLKEMKDNLSAYNDFDDHGRGLYTGWVEALEYVLNKEKENG